MKLSPQAVCITLLATLFNLAHAEVARPNIVLILADDLGFSDIASYGSEIQTPSLDALAASGISFTNYHTAASCAPTRAMLLTGVDSHRNGVPNIPESIPPAHQVHENYRGVLSRNVVTVASLLQNAGYHTYMAGKWHLGKARDELPYRRGFSRTITLADTGADNWEQKPYIPIYEKANWFADGEETTLPEDFYSSAFLIDKTIEFIDSNSDSQPFFAYIPFQAVHIPVQAPKEFTDKYLDTYQQGWTALREQRQKRSKELGIIPANAEMQTMSSTHDWDSLSAEEKRFHAKRMAVYAGMVDAMDHHIGRLVAHLKATGRYDNTIFIFSSDNGSEATGGDNPRSLLNRLGLRMQGYTNDYDTLGSKGSFNTIGPSFASAAASPLAYYKFYAGEGGMRVPLIIAGKPISDKAKLSNAFTFVTDITPTILEFTSTPAPTEFFGGRRIVPMIGRSLAALSRGEVDQVYTESDYIGYELGGNAALFQGSYKIVKNRGPVGDSEWHLFNIVDDPGETNDLREAMPDKVADLLEHYHQYAAENGVLDVPANFNGTTQVAINGIRDRFGKPLLVLLLTSIISGVFYILYRRK
ncbi:arylsulfatase [uncultured Zhongshania sp.]|uniref:arylsulfatase n=1 Tax=uncultured Zhongshania sp. TaxID=1642288 RepID=UPI0025D74438|nr:arylsulfatase [uncultured Zhongshania sp.]